MGKVKVKVKKSQLKQINEINSKRREEDRESLEPADAKKSGFTKAGSYMLITPVLYCTTELRKPFHLGVAILYGSLTLLALIFLVIGICKDKAAHN